MIFDLIHMYTLDQYKKFFYISDWIYKIVASLNYIPLIKLGNSYHHQLYMGSPISFITVDDCVLHSIITNRIGGRS